MKATILIERTLANTFTIDLPETYVPTSSGILDYAREVYEKMIDQGKEPELGDQVDSSLHLYCMECNQEIEEGDPTAVENDGRIVCSSCHHHLRDHSEREKALKEAGIDLEEVARTIRATMLECNHSLYSASFKRLCLTKLTGIEWLLSAMNIPFAWEKSEDRFVGLILNGKTYTV